MRMAIDRAQIDGATHPKKQDKSYNKPINQEKNGKTFHDLLKKFTEFSL